MADRPLTAKQEKFVIKWAELGNKSEAYRQAYPKSKKWKESAVNTQATILSKNSKVLERYNEIMKALEKESIAKRIISDELVQQMQLKAYNLAMEQKKPSIMIRCANSISKANGYGADFKHKRELDLMTYELNKQRTEASTTTEEEINEEHEDKLASFFEALADKLPN